MRIEAVVPPRDEQIVIGRFLDERIAKLDRLIETKKIFIERLMEKRSALVSQVVTRGLPPDEAKKHGLPVSSKMKPSGVDWLGEIPEHWNVDRLRRRCNRVTDGAHISPDLSSSDFPFVSTVDIRKSGVIDFESCLRTSAESYEYLARNNCRPYVGDVLFSKDGTIG
jgi:type I restriction enzyme S subunit